ncbi:uncharacterized protein [Elaeis guineensis]|uniref:uncharacterized protein isoform X2 n=1 Tax=Elaeis guineensis var. tenera TaxID=51953 RepID=UPI003C6DAAA9
MGSEKSGETLSLRKRRPMEAAEEDEEEREIQELEKEVGEMARRLLDFRGTIPDRLMEAFSSRLVAQRPLFSPQIGATSAPSETLVGADSGAASSVGLLESEIKINYSQLNYPSVYFVMFRCTSGITVEWGDISCRS